MLSGNEALYPGLMAFTSGVPTAASVDQLTGVGTLHNNHYDFITATIQTGLTAW